MKEKEIGCMGWAVQRDEHSNNVSNCISPKLLGEGGRHGERENKYSNPGVLHTL